MEEKTFRIRDLRNGSWFWVNTAVWQCPHIRDIDKVVYGSLATFAGNDRIYPSYDIIAKRCAVSVRSAIRAMKVLTEAGFVTIIVGGGRGKANEYELPKATKGCLKCTLSVKGDQNGKERVTNVHPNKIIDINNTRVSSQKTNAGLMKMYRPEPDETDEIVDTEGNTVTPSPKKNHSKAMWDLVRWAEEERGAKFAAKFIPKQFAAIKGMKQSGITHASTIKERWQELASQKFYQENGLDFASVLSSFSRKPQPK